MAEEYTIGRLAKTVGLSRSTLLYYDKLGLLRPINRTEGNYRLYSADEVERLRRICTYREMGIPLKQIGELVDRRSLGDSSSQAMLERHLESLEREIEALRKQQRQVVMLLEQITSRTSHRGSGKKRSQRPRAQSKGPKTSTVTCIFNERRADNGSPALEGNGSNDHPIEMQTSKTLENDMLKKDRWVEIMRAAGLTDDDMHNWHRQFEKLEPDAHQEFLESLGIDADEIGKIREWSKS